MSFRSRRDLQEKDRVSSHAQPSTVPAAAAWLGGLGAIPFVALAVAMPVVPAATRPVVALALTAYGAVILSFLGGIHWGMAIVAPAGAGDRLPARLALSVVPSLVAWAALLVPERMALVGLAVAVALMLWVDLRATAAGEAPAWYPRLRVPLSAAVVASLLLAAFAFTPS